jgi:hypothetical protein
MPSDGGMAGLLLLSDQLSTYRLLDKLDQNRHNNELVVDNALLRHEADELIARYNQVVTQANDLYRHATEVAQDRARKDSVITQLEHRAEVLRRANIALEAQCEQFRLQLDDKRTQIALLREIVRQDHPDRYLPE